ncbi:uncharacterized protein LOC119554817 [Drosophila subpulchrella]|uniref:uncharacterized protein LOC119554817 n=1 Tax=Drosophila subpulchrella TaxID=1486046 RepID=UPI0018A1957B|nr:uncharacterized protein LOC119554817 [Drosophila subpulchrella]
MKSLTTVELMLDPLYEDDSLYAALQELPHLTDLHFHDFSEKNVHKVRYLVNLDRLVLQRGRKECPVDIIQIFNSLKKLRNLFLECDEISCNTSSQKSTYSALIKLELIVDKVPNLPIFPNLRYMYALSDKNFNWNKWIISHAETVKILYIHYNSRLLEALERCKVLRDLGVFVKSSEISEEHLSLLIDFGRRNVSSLSLAVKNEEEYKTIKKRLEGLPYSAICKVHVEHTCA